MRSGFERWTQMELFYAHYLPFALGFGAQSQSLAFEMCVYHLQPRVPKDMVAHDVSESSQP